MFAKTALHREIEKLKKMVLNLGSIVEENVCSAVESVEKRDVKLAKKVIATEPEIDVMEIELEEECLKILALHQPVAIDLRLIIAVLKINNDLERVDDLAANIAERSLSLATREPISIPSNLEMLAEKAITMLRQGLDAQVNMDSSLAERVIALDDEVDDLHKDMYRCIQDQIKSDPASIELLMQLISVSRCLERIADLATNIAEDVIYMVKGEIVRHQKNQA
jgi:phosphate transport system protein